MTQPLAALAERTTYSHAFFPGPAIFGHKAFVPRSNCSGGGRN